VAVGRLVASIDEMNAALDELGRVPLSRELRLTMRSDILARYQKVRSLYWRYPGIVDRLRAAEGALDAEGPAIANGIGPIESETHFRRTIAALERLRASLGPGGTMRPIPADVRRIFLRELGERRAEVMSRFHLVEAKRQDARGKPMKARTHLLALLQSLRKHGPNTGFVRELAAEADTALANLSDQRVVADFPDTDVNAA